MSAPPLPDVLVKRLEWLESQGPNLTLDGLYGPLNKLLALCFRLHEKNDWMLHPLCPIYQAATPQTENRMLDQFHRDVDQDSQFDTPNYIVCKFTAAADNDRARLVISIVGNESDTYGMKRLEKWTKKLYEGLDDAHGAKALQAMLITGVFAQVFNLVKEGEAIQLVPVFERMNLRSSEFFEYLHKCSLEDM